MDFTLQELYGHPAVTFNFSVVSTASFRVNAEAPSLDEVPFQDNRKYNWYCIPHQTPDNYKVNLDALVK